MKEKIIVAIAIILIVGAGVWAWKKFSNYQPSNNTNQDNIEQNNMVQQLEEQGLLKIEDVKIGDGAEAHLGNTLSMNYLGTLTNGKKFDSSYDRGKPFEFQIGASQVIPGWDIGILGMKVGGKRKLTIAPQLAYGDQAIGAIPANSTLIFEVELLKVTAN